jgi:hypothetical protein
MRAALKNVFTHSGPIAAFHQRQLSGGAGELIDHLFMLLQMVRAIA